MFSSQKPRHLTFLGCTPLLSFLHSRLSTNSQIIIRRLIASINYTKSSGVAMAMNTINISLPFVVAAGAGIYFIDKNHYKPKETGGGIRASIENFMRQAKVQVSSTQMPKLAPQFDGLDS